MVFIKEQIDFYMIGAIVEFERDLINERTSEGVLVISENTPFRCENPASSLDLLG